MLAEGTLTKCLFLVAVGQGTPAQAVKHQTIPKNLWKKTNPILVQKYHMKGDHMFRWKKIRGIKYAMHC